MISDKTEPTPPQKPIEPGLDSKGRSIADHWAIRIMIVELQDPDKLQKVVLALSDQTTDIKSNVNHALQNELGNVFCAQLNTPTLQQECEQRIRFLVNEIRAMIKDRYKRTL